MDQMGDITVTIVTPSFNQGAFIEETILSVLHQTYPNIEFIIVDGGSTDQTNAILEKYKDNFTLIQGMDHGQTDAINIGFRVAKGTLVGWLCSDDLLEPDAVEKIVGRYRQNPDASIYLGALRMIDEQGNFLYIPKHKACTFDDLLHGRPSLVQPGSFYQKMLLQKIDYLDTRLHMMMDVDLFLRLLKISKAEFIPDILSSARLHKSAKTSVYTWRALKEGIQIRRRNGLGVLGVINYAVRRLIHSFFVFPRVFQKVEEA